MYHIGSSPFGTGRVIRNSKHYVRSMNETSQPNWINSRAFKMTTTVSDPTAPIASYPPDLMRSDLDQGSLIAAMRTQPIFRRIPEKSPQLAPFEGILGDFRLV
ncbi:hypothetical protein AXFE_08160 [Acidithrix ferrooxidans]|uniref:Uncharacterized protein n=1 Tax=Acidithrix ferrooxidans TaxID=1280514 RepID=A0A0D8HKI4_9ACTN|nr:hypothetical protein AXFE_08160 [Acidithrix ferrooxidans]